MAGRWVELYGSAQGGLKGSSKRENRKARYKKRFGVGICWPVQEPPASQESLCVKELVNKTQAYFLIGKKSSNETLSDA